MSINRNNLYQFVIFGRWLFCTYLFLWWVTIRIYSRLKFYRLEHWLPWTKWKHRCSTIKANFHNISKTPLDWYVYVATYLLFEYFILLKNQGTFILNSLFYWLICWFFFVKIGDLYIITRLHMDYICSTNRESTNMCTLPGTAFSTTNFRTNYGGKLWRQEKRWRRCEQYRQGPVYMTVIHTEYDRVVELKFSWHHKEITTRG